MIRVWTLQKTDTHTVDIQNDADFQSHTDVQGSNAKVPNFTIYVIISPNVEVEQKENKYNKGEQVYDKYHVDRRGQPTRSPLWICCRKWNKKKKCWYYRIKDGPQGRSIKWVPENEVEFLWAVISLKQVTAFPGGWW